MDTGAERPEFVGISGYRVHGERPELLGELHARPFDIMPTPRRIYHFAFATDDDEARLDREAIANICRARAAPPPAPGAKYFRLQTANWRMRWEQHAEFTTYTFDTGLNAAAPFAEPAFPCSDGPEFPFRPPGALLVGTHMSVVDGTAGQTAPGDLFDGASLCACTFHHGAARAATDFQAHAQAFTRFLVEDYGLGPARMGVLTQRLLEIETYRTLALRGLFAARRAAPQVRRIERELAALTRAISASEDIDANHQLLEKLIDMAAELEAQTAETAGRFSASQAYYNIVNARLSAIREEEVGGAMTFTAFLIRRLGPAMTTCEAVDHSQAQLSQKLLRTANLLRTRIQFALEGQNRDLLRSMNRRARMQLRLQQTVEGLSVAAVSYYFVGLIGYVAKGAEKGGLKIAPELVMAGSVPLVVLAVWLLVHRVRRHFTRADAEAATKEGRAGAAGGSLRAEED